VPLLPFYKIFINQSRQSLFKEIEKNYTVED